MGSFAEECAASFGFTRQEQDKFASISVERAREAMEKGYFNEEIAPSVIETKEGKKTIQQDEGILTARPEKISLLKPVFKKEGTITAANASSISDGAAALVLMKHSEAQQKKIEILATVEGFYIHAQAPNLFTTAPIEAIQKLLACIAWTIDSVDLFEINEAFAVVAMAAMQTLKIPHEKVNINGGACVLGHPIGASGARIVVSLINALRQRQLKRGVAALCIGGGEAMALAIRV